MHMYRKCYPHNIIYTDITAQHHCMMLSQLAREMDFRVWFPPVIIDNLNPCDYNCALFSIDLWLCIEYLRGCTIYKFGSKLISVPPRLTKINHTVDWLWYCFGLLAMCMVPSSALLVYDYFSCMPGQCPIYISWDGPLHIVNLTRLDKPVFVGWLK